MLPPTRHTAWLEAALARGVNAIIRSPWSTADRAAFIAEHVIAQHDGAPVPAPPPEAANERRPIAQEEVNSLARLLTSALNAATRHEDAWSMRSVGDALARSAAVAKTVEEAVETAHPFVAPTVDAAEAPAAEAVADPAAPWVALSAAPAAEG